MPEAGENIIASLSQPRVSGFEKESFSIAGDTPAICSGRRLSLTIIHGSKTAIMPPSCAVNSQRPRSPGLRIYGTQTLGLCAAQVYDLCSIADRASAFTLVGVYDRRAGVLKTSAVADRRYSKTPQPESGCYASIAFQFQPARSDFSPNDNCSSSFMSSTFHLPSTFTK